ncbi:O-antigen ligase family protein [Candidatus Parcubacteria bacterium]|jgi:O-antigen ligase|nr:O-antigen ligase family protein [Candidatus Parcubacteria bacterium]
MQNRLTASSIFLNWQTPALLGIFLGIRILSFYLAPHAILQAIIVFTMIFILGLTFFKNPDYAWMIIMGELLLGGAGHFLEFFGLSIRTVLILVFLFLWIVYSLSNRDKTLFKIHIPHNLYYVLIPLVIFLIISVTIGIFNGHKAHYVIQDLIPFSFFALLLPAFHLFREEKMQYYFVRLIIVFFIGSAIFSLFTFGLFITETVEIHGVFYEWFRDIAMGKVTFVTDFFYRIVTPEHILIPPLMLIGAALLMRDEKHNKMWRFMFLCGALVLALNFSRAYLLGFVIGLIFLKYKHKMRRWLTVSIWSIAMIVLVFMSVNIVSSMGTSFGFEIAGIRIGSMVLPETEVSTNTRSALLRPIFTMIKEHPVTGSGLGATLSYINPYTYTQINTRHFDWGYLEMLVELGIIGSVILLSVIVLLIYELIKKIQSISDFQDLYIGLLGGIVALLIINITAPALYHVLGIFYFAFVMAFVSKPVDLFDNVVTTLYRVFNKVKH